MIENNRKIIRVSESAVFDEAMARQIISSCVYQNLVSEKGVVSHGFKQKFDDALESFVGIIKRAYDMEMIGLFDNESKVIFDKLMKDFKKSLKSELKDTDLAIVDSWYAKPSAISSKMPCTSNADIMLGMNDVENVCVDFCGHSANPHKKPYIRVYGVGSDIDESLVKIIYEFVKKSVKSYSNWVVVV
jgi:hypothetical protein